MSEKNGVYLKFVHDSEGATRKTDINTTKIHGYMNKDELRHILKFGPDISYPIVQVRTYELDPSGCMGFETVNKEYEALNRQSDHFKATGLVSNTAVLFGKVGFDLWESCFGYLEHYISNIVKYRCVEHEISKSCISSKIQVFSLDEVPVCTQKYLNSSALLSQAL